MTPHFPYYTVRAHSNSPGAGRSVARDSSLTGGGRGEHRAHVANLPIFADDSRIEVIVGAHAYLRREKDDLPDIFVRVMPVPVTVAVAA